ncbi:MAG TPA: peptidoglycan-binding protein, partial [Ktedonobacteraceae bacterium]
MTQHHADLSLNQQGREVAVLQSRLVAIGYSITSSEILHEFFGESTQLAVLQFQRHEGLDSTGVVDALTAEAIRSRYELDKTTIAPRVSSAQTPEQSHQPHTETTTWPNHSHKADKWQEADKMSTRPSAVERESTNHDDTYSVSGHVTDPNGEPLPHAAVVALSLDIRTSHELGRTHTNAAGLYSIKYAQAEQARNKGAIDLRVELFDAQGKVVLASPITFNAPGHTTINLALGGTQHAQPSEFTMLTSTLTPLLGQLSATDLREDAEYQDLTFLAGATSIARSQIALWSIAAHVASNTQLPPELFYALFTSNIPANADTIALASSTQGIDLATNAQLLQEALLSATPQVLEKALDNALTTNVIPASYASRAKGDLAQLGALATTAALHSVHGMGKTSIASVMNVLSLTPDTQNKFIRLYASVSSAKSRTFWSDLYKNADFTADQVADLHFGIIVGRITRGYLPLITELAAWWRAKKITHTRDLARLTAADWAALLRTSVDGKSIGIPTNITAASPEQALQVYAAMLERDFCLAYPTVAFSARL